MAGPPSVVVTKVLGTVTVSAIAGISTTNSYKAEKRRLQRENEKQGKSEPESVPSTEVWKHAWKPVGVMWGILGAGTIAAWFL